ncbi:glycogen debranching protein GlgX [Ancylobacter pratisalsi]|uniref:4-alpha-glucanotransferase n=1 Tax=Ancylobacter pratisalsi TaxID=1745854 RepID=A0A6P1YJX6_9HYPH|nr:glycogen debranching protein GlgX [Ancylobacter pratisalsi]QIB33016.1 glycogen debranching protein GlgX [Ancylobacter pratisalsi]
MSTYAIDDGSPEPLGVTADGRGVNVAVFSAHAERIEFCLFDPAGETEIARIVLPARTGDVFHAHIGDVPPGARYGLRATGPWAPEAGHRFNPYKLLVDPYASRLDRPFQLAPALFDTRALGAPRDEVDSAHVVPKAIVAHPSAEPPSRAGSFPWDDEVLYELHVRGYTRQHPDIAVEMRGTFAALAEPPALEHLVRLGVTTVELMPAMAWVDERHLPPLGLTNYWGYNPVVFGAPDPRLAPGGFPEVRRAIEALHEAGIRVVLDVVLNHTGESDASGPTISLRGLDNATYYRHARENAGLLINDAGTGNTLALERMPVLRLGMDMLRRWAGAGLDGFRFDLAATLGRRPDGFDPEAPFFAALRQDPQLRELALIAEPWDIGPGGYQVGQFPAEWAEWNDKFRDTARRFWRGEDGVVGELATRFAGSADVFAARHRPLSRAINFITAHDGFTLADLVSFEHKHNEANGEDNRDGTNDNHSWNHGAEGWTDDAAIIAARQADMRALLATLITARGTPMLTMGDECGRSQAGNNNAYAQDNELTWLDWSKVDEELAGFTARLIALRREHRALRGAAPLEGRPVDGSGIADVEWRAPEGGPVPWDAPGNRVLVVVLYAPASGSEGADRVTVALNASGEARTLTLPEPREGFAWRLAIDTARPDGSEEGATLSPRSVQVLVEQAVAGASRREVDPALLEKLSSAAGIAPEWWDVEGTHHAVSDDTKRALLKALRLPSDGAGEVRDSLAKLSDQHFGHGVPFARVLRVGAARTLRLGGTAATASRRLDLGLRLEDGSEMELAIRPEEGERKSVLRPDGRLATVSTVTLPEMPVGRHTLTFGDETCRLTVAPRACYLPSSVAKGERRFGVAAHLYTLRRGNNEPVVYDQGIGDFTTLADLGARAGAEGATVLGLNPLHALFPSDRERASPYSPSDRRFLDPIYIDVEALGADMSAFAGLGALASVDYARVWALKQAALRTAFARFDAAPDPDFDQFVAEGGAVLRRFAAFEAISAAQHGASWRDWPDGLAMADSAAVDAFAGAHAHEVRFALWLQWVADRQFAAAAGTARAAGLELGFYRDLAVGTAMDGAEAWSEAGMLMQGVTIGAPPDPLGPEGQNWNLPPFDPLALQRDGYQSFARLVAANMRHAGALRIDHVMGLRRLFLMPKGEGAVEGAYLSMPFEDLAGQVALESERAKCLVVGEDLGTVPVGMREQLAEERMLSYRVLWFERRDGDFAPPEAYPEAAAACVSTHDLPTLAGWWIGADLDERRALGLETEATLAAARLERVAEKGRLGAALLREGLIAEMPAADAALDDGFVAAVHAFIARTGSVLAFAQFDDLAGETVAVNLPGTDRERPNWRRRLALPAKDVFAGSRARAALAAMKGERGD